MKKSAQLFYHIAHVNTCLISAFFNALILSVMTNNQVASSNQEGTLIVFLVFNLALSRSYHLPCLTTQQLVRKL